METDIIHNEESNSEQSDHYGEVASEAETNGQPAQQLSQVPIWHEIPQEQGMLQCGHPVCSKCEEFLNSTCLQEANSDSYSFFPRWDGTIHYLIFVTNGK